MAHRNFLIGVGGSGARCVEAFLHLAAAGLAPPSVSIAIIDPDSAHHSTNSAQKSLTDVRALREQWRRPGGHRLASDCPFLSSELSALDGAGKWSPSLPEDGKKARLFFQVGGMHRPIRGLFHTLFNESDDDFDLTNGYRGRANIGAALMTASTLTEDKLLKELTDEIALSGQESRVFLVGSIFGGTGAAGLPTLARMIARRVGERRASVRIAAGLLLPYFNYPEPPETEKGSAPGSTKDDTRIYARSEEFLRRAENALRYYNTVMRSDGIYDALYVLGLDQYLRQQFRGLGGADQANPPMLPELVIAFGALHHFKLDAVQGREVYFCDRSAADKFEWKDIPLPTTIKSVDDSGSRQRVRRQLGELLRFAFAFRYVYRPALRPESMPRVAQESWYRRHIGDEGADQDALESLDTYCSQLLKWTAELNMASQVPGVFRAQLFNADLYAEQSGPKFDVQPKGKPALSEFGSLVAGGPEPGLAHVFESLTYGPVPQDTLGLGRFATALFNACKMTEQK